MFRIARPNMGLDLDKAAPEGAGAPEVEITDDMIEAGASEILGEVGGADLGGCFSARDLASRVYREMAKARQVTGL